MIVFSSGGAGSLPERVFGVYLLLSALLVFSCAASSARAEDGVSDDRIVFGQTAAMTGSADILGQGMRAGLLAAFSEANARGGVQGRKLDLISLDDGYEPDQAIDNAEHLVRDQKVFAFAGVVGTPISNAILPIINEDNIPMIGTYSGARLLRTPFHRNIINVRASYAQETELWARWLVDLHGEKRMAVLFQDDTYGRAGLDSFEQALALRNLKLVAVAGYPRNTTAVKSALLKIRAANPDVVGIAGGPAPAAEFIHLAQELGWNPKFINLSFVGSDRLWETLGAQGKGVIVTQVVPLPDDTSQEIVRSYQQAMEKFQPDARRNFIALEGYIAGRLIISVLEGLSGPITREAFIDRVYAQKEFQIDNLHLVYGENDNQGLDLLYMNVLRDDRHFDYLNIDDVQKKSGGKNSIH